MQQKHTITKETNQDRIATEASHLVLKLLPSYVVNMHEGTLYLCKCLNLQGL